MMDKSDGAVELENVSLTLNWRHFSFSTFPSTVHIASINPSQTSTPWQSET